MTKNFQDLFRRLQTIVKKVLFYSKELFFKRSYSQFGEDLLLQGFLGEKWSWNYKGFYIDIGAHHPTRLSNTKIYYDVGWRGINVDASCEAIKAFRRARRRDVNVNVGIGKEAGTLDYYRMSLSPMNTFSKEFADQAIDGGVKLLEVVKVPVITMKDLLDRHLPPGQSIDFLSIDCEGLDLEILESNDWGRYRPEFILIEIHTGGRNWEIPDSRVARYLRERGYEIVGQGCVTSLFRRISRSELEVTCSMPEARVQRRAACPVPEALCPVPEARASAKGALC